MQPVLDVAAAPFPEWILVGWLGSVALLLLGYAIAFAYYTENETPPDVDESPEVNL